MQPLPILTRRGQHRVARVTEIEVHRHPGHREIEVREWGDSGEQPEHPKRLPHWVQPFEAQAEVRVVVR